MQSILALAPALALGPSWLDPQTLLGDFGLWGAAAVVFAECGILLGFLLPGDSLLFTVGLLIHNHTLNQNIVLACAVLSLAAFAGNAVGYEIGRAAGPAVFRPDSRIFKQKHVDRTIAFFDTYGGRAIVLARFVPIVRTFITVVAGVGRMDRSRFLTYSAIGAVLWASGVTMLGFVLGSIAFVREHIEVILVLVVLISVLPPGIEILRARMSRRGGPAPAGRHAAE